MQWIPDGLKFPESAGSLDFQGDSNSYFSSSNCFIFHQVVKKQFSSEASYSVLKRMNFSFYVGIGTLIVQQWQTCYQYRHILLSQHLFPKNYCFETSIIVGNDVFKLLDDSYKEPLICYQYWNVVKPKWRRVRIIFSFRFLLFTFVLRYLQVFR